MIPDCLKQTKNPMPDIVYVLTNEAMPGIAVAALHTGPGATGDEIAGDG